MSRAVTPMGMLVLPASAPREQWLAARRHGITATDIAKIVGVSPYGDAIDTYLDKRAATDDTGPGEAAHWGQLLEDQVAREWARRNTARVRRVGLLRHRNHPRHMASCDRLTDAREVLEVKTRSAFVGWDDGIPERVTVQTQWQLHVTGLSVAHVAALVGGQRLEQFTVTRDDTLIAYLADEADRVWECVEAGRMPEVALGEARIESLNRAFPNRAGAVDLDPADADEWAGAYRDAAAREKTAKADKDRAKAALVQMLGGAEEGLVGGRTLCTYRAGKPTVAVPAARARALLEDHPDIAAQYVEGKAPTRTFRLA